MTWMSPCNGVTATWGDLEATLLLKDPKVICCTQELAVRVKSRLDLEGQRLLHPVLENSSWSDIVDFLDVQAPDDASEPALIPLTRNRKEPRDHDRGKSGS